jgi:hypothetical protein
VEETFDLSEGITGGVGIDIDRKNPKHLPARSRFGEGRRNSKFETKLINSKLKTLSSLPTGRQVNKLKCLKHKTQNRMTQEIVGSIVEKSEYPFEFYILDLFRI